MFRPQHIVSLPLLVLCVLGTWSSGCVRQEFVPTRRPRAPAPMSAPSQLTLVGPIALGESVRATAPAEAAMAAGYAFSVRAGSRIKIELDRLVVGVQATLYGPMRAGGAVTPIAQGDGPHTIPTDGTYVVGVSAPSPVGFTLELECMDEECRLECGPQNECGVGAGCILARCIRAPCPSFCEASVGEQLPEPEPLPEPLPETTSGASGAICGTRGAPPCSDGLFCRHPVEAACGAADHPGECVTVPQGCSHDYAPVCGCDGQTYPNDCAASANRVSVRVSEACPD